jgi:thioesterase domain-containing protein
MIWSCMFQPASSRRGRRLPFKASVERLARRDMLAPVLAMRELESNDTAATSQELRGFEHYRVTGRVASIADVDSFSFTADAGARLAIDVRATGRTGRAARDFSPRLTVHAPDGSVISTAPARGAGHARRAEFAFLAATGGTYRLVVSGRQQEAGIGRQTGGYALRLRTAPPSSDVGDIAPAEADVLTRLALYRPTSATPSASDWQPLVANDTRLSGKNVYVAVHGWATDYAGVPALNGTTTDPLKWWQTIDYQSLLTPASKTLTEPVAAYMFLGQVGEDGGSTQATLVSPAGLAWQLKQSDPDAEVLIYSWVDDSAQLLPAPSETFTALNGARLASALEQALPSGDGPRGLHLIGHSHGSKVATVAATLLRQHDLHVNHLTILDSPERTTNVTDFNATNHLWYFLPALSIDRGQAAGTTFVDNYISDLDRRLGLIQGYDPYALPAVKVSALQQVADVTLDAGVLMPPSPSSFDSFAHRYAPAWYAGGSAAWASNPSPTVANQWSPLVANPAVARPVAGSSIQMWRTTADPQFALTPGSSPAIDLFDPSPQPLALKQVVKPFARRPAFDGTVTLSGDGKGQEVTTAYTFKTPPLDDTHAFGISFNLQFSAFEADDQLQITVNTGLGSDQKLVYVMTAKQLGLTEGLATLSLGSLAQYPGLFNTKQIEFSLVPSEGSQCRTTVTISNIKQFIVPGA